MAWIARDQIPLLAPVALVQFLAALAVVPALVGIVYLLGMRDQSPRGATLPRYRTGHACRSANLERTVALLSRSLDANRRELAGQIATLMAMGDGANERLAGIGRGLAAEIGQADAHAGALSRAAADAQGSLGVLLASLPRARMRRWRRSSACSTIPSLSASGDQLLYHHYMQFLIYNLSTVILDHE